MMRFDLEEKAAFGLEIARKERKLSLQEYLSPTNREERSLQAPAIVARKQKKLSPEATEWLELYFVH
jgi:hypothetical protein